MAGSELQLAMHPHVTPTSLGPYEILSLIGAGGGGEVYRAWDPRLERHVALKILHRRAETDPDRVHRFVAEARAASALNHPNIVTVFDAAVDDAVPYIVAELVDGRPLRDELARGPVPLKRLLDLATQIADGLAAAHDAGIVHRDLKPENVMVTRTGRVKILDFGLARGAVSSAMPPGTPIATSFETMTDMALGAGTAPYMSPEQARGAATDYRSDQFSFGLMLFEMLTGRPAYPARDARGDARRHHQRRVCHRCPGLARACRCHSNGSSSAVLPRNLASAT